MAYRARKHVQIDHAALGELAFHQFQFAFDRTGTPDKAQFAFRERVSAAHVGNVAGDQIPVTARPGAIRIALDEQFAAAGHRGSLALLAFARVPSTLAHGQTTFARVRMRTPFPQSDSRNQLPIRYPYANIITVMCIKLCIYSSLANQIY